MSLSDSDMSNDKLLDFVMSAMEDGFAHIESLVFGMPPKKANHLIDELDGRIFIVKNNGKVVGFVRCPDKEEAWQIAVDNFPIPKDKNPFGEVPIGGGSLHENKSGERINTKSLEIREIEPSDFAELQMTIQLRY